MGKVSGGFARAVLVVAACCVFLLAASNAGAAVTASSFTLTAANPQAGGASNLAIAAAFTDTGSDTPTYIRIALPSGMTVTKPAQLCNATALAVGRCPTATQIGSASLSVTLLGVLNVSLSASVFAASPADASQTFQVVVALSGGALDFPVASAVSGTLGGSSTPIRVFALAAQLRHLAMTLDGTVGGHAFVTMPASCGPLAATLQFLSTATNAAGSATTSFSATGCPAIATGGNPASVSVLANAMATFSAQASGATGAQWLVSAAGGPFTPDTADTAVTKNVSGVESSTLSVSSVSGAQTGNEYEAVFTNGAAQTTTAPAALTVITAQAPEACQGIALPTIVVPGTYQMYTSGAPLPTVSWKNELYVGNLTNGETLQDGTTVSITNAMDGPTCLVSTLQLHNYGPGDDNQDLLATATNTVGTATQHFNTGVLAPGIVLIPASGLPATTSGSVGDGVLLQVSANGSPAPVATWTDNGVKLKSATSLPDGTQVSIGDYGLVLTELAPDQNGAVISVTFASSAGTVSTSTTLALTTPPPANPQLVPAAGLPAQTVVDVGGSVTLQVSATAPNPPSVSWDSSSGGPLYNGETLADGTTVAINSTGLTLGNVAAAEQGTTIYFDAGNGTPPDATTQTTLSVDLAPQLVPATGLPTQTSIVTGASTHLALTATGSPTPTPTWTDNGAVLSNGQTLADGTTVTIDATGLTLANIAAAESGNVVTASFDNGTPPLATTQTTLSLTSEFTTVTPTPAAGTIKAASGSSTFEVGLGLQEAASSPISATWYEVTPAGATVELGVANDLTGLTVPLDGSTTETVYLTTYPLQTVNGSATYWPSSNLTVRGADPVSSGDRFYCVVSNAYGTVTSATWTLVVA